MTKIYRETDVWPRKFYDIAPLLLTKRYSPTDPWYLFQATCVKGIVWIHSPLSTFPKIEDLWNPKILSIVFRWLTWQQNLPKLVCRLHPLSVTRPVLCSRFPGRVMEDRLPGQHFPLPPKNLKISLSPRFSNEGLETCIVMGLRTCAPVDN